jgi:HD-like signal output (HDOD) protein
MSGVRMRVLFVDDQDRVLAGLRDLLWRKRGEWEMVFAGSASEALRELGGGLFDVIVSDLRMPNMDGVQLLEQVREEYPQVARVVLSGYAEVGSALRAARVAHQFLAKPCRPEELIATLERIAALESLLPGSEIRAVLGRIEKLPATSESYARLHALLRSEHPDLATIADVLEGDVSMCAKLLQLANSAFFGLRGSAQSVQEIVAALGLDLIRALTLGVEIFMNDVPPELTRFWAAAQRHSLATAELTGRILAAQGIASADGFIAGTLHDIGLLVIAEKLERPRMQQSAGESPSVPVHHVEWAFGEGLAHPQIGAYLLGLWGFGDSLVQAVAYHHAPSRLARAPADLLVALHAADALIQETDRLHFECDAQLDLEFLARARALGRLPEWERLAAKVIESLPDDAP